MSSSAKSRIFRRRGEEDENAVETPSTSGKNLVSGGKSISSSKSNKLLSFVDDEEEAEGMITTHKARCSSSKPKGTLSSSNSKPPTSAHKLTSSKDRLPSAATSTTSNVLPQAGTYTKEALLELQKNMRTLTKPSYTPIANSSIITEPTVILKGSLKPDEATDEIDGESDEDSRKPSIPDEETIKKIREKRERLRMGGKIPPPDFISLESGNEVKPSNEEEDDDEDDLEGNTKENVPFEAVNAALDDNSNEEDEEEKLWEEEQFRKGLGKRIETPRQNMSAPSAIFHRQPPQNPASFGADSLSIQQQAEIAMRALRESVVKLKENNVRTHASLTKADENLSSSLLKITSLEKSVALAGEKFIFMQKLRDFISVLCEFLQHKGPFIEELEEQIQNLRSQRASAAFERRIAENEDEMTEIEAAVNSAKSVFAELGNSTAALGRAADAARAAVSSSKARGNLPVKLDDYGRDLNQQKRLDYKRREKAREERRKKRASSMDIDGIGSKVEGESSTGESESESDAYTSNTEMLLSTAKKIFSDASDEFSSLSVVKQKLEEWKSQYASAYRDAYVALSTPSIFSPYVRLELLEWDPLRRPTDFFSMTWHSSLFDYGMPEGGNGNGAVTDPDGNLVPELVEKVAIPILLKEVYNCWDVFSTKQTLNAVSATSSVVSYIESSSGALTELLTAIRCRLENAVGSLTVPTWDSMLLKVVPEARAVSAYRFGMSIRLLKSIGLWKDILASHVVEDLALDEVLCRKILPHMQSIYSNLHEAVGRTERVVGSLTGVWVGPNVVGDYRKKMRPLSEFVMSLWRKLEKRQLPEAEAIGIARRLKKMSVMLDDTTKMQG